jgi:hypothetical protein
MAADSEKKRSVRGALGSNSRNRKTGVGDHKPNGKLETTTSKLATKQRPEVRLGTEQKP